LEHKIFGHCFIVFELQKTFCNSTSNASKATKIVQIGFEEFRNERDHCLIQANKTKLSFKVQVL
jgi:hypothetical protein